MSHHFLPGMCWDHPETDHGPVRTQPAAGGERSKDARLTMKLTFDRRRHGIGGRHPFFLAMT